MSPLTSTLATFAPLAVELLLKTAVLLILAEGVTRLLRRAPAATRHLVWTLSVLAILALPLLVVSGPRVGLPGLSLSAPQSVPAPEARSESDPAATVAAPPPSTETSVPAGERPRQARDETSATGLPVPQLLALVWLLGGAALVARVLVGSLGAWHLVRTAVPADSSWEPVYREAAAALDLSRPVRLLSSARADVPMVWGTWNPAVVLPAAADDWSAHRRRLVLVHELAHVRRRDCLVQLFAHVATALYWLNPLAWRAAARLRAERELACDDLVLTTGARGSEYARHLLDIARDARGFRPGYGVALPMARPSQLEGRLLAILNADRVARGSARTLRLVLPAIFAAVLVTVAVVDPWTPPTLAAEPAPGGSPMSEIRSPIQSDPDLAQQAASRLAAELGARFGAEIGAAMGELAVGEASQAAPPPQETPEREATRARVLDAMTGALAAEDAGMRADAAHALGMMESPDAVPALVQALGDPEVRVRRQVAWALGMIESDEAVPGLLAALEDEDDDVRAQAVWSLGMIESEEAAPRLLAVVDDPSVEIRKQVAWALGMIESDAGLEAATRLLSDAEPGVRAQAAWALGMIESPEAVPGLVDALGDAEVQVRLQAIWALGMIEDDRALDGLLDAMESDDRRVQRAAMQAIAQITG